MDDWRPTKRFISDGQRLMDRDVKFALKNAGQESGRDEGRGLPAGRS